MRAKRRWVAIGVLILGIGCGGSSSKKPDGGSSSGGSSGPAAGSGGGSGSGSAGTKSGSGGGTSSGSGGSSSGSGGSSSGSGGTSSGSGGTSSGSGGASSGSGGTSSGSGGTSSGSGGSSGSSNLPTDGNQLSVCSMPQGECNKGYVCNQASSVFSAGRGFCTKICTMDSDCDGLAPSGTKYVCSTGAGTTHYCEIPCQGGPDAGSSTCPSNMTCQQTAPMTMGTMAQYQCKYPLERSPMWGPCNDGTHECEAMMTCNGIFSSPSRRGYCVPNCTMDSDCSTKPSSGTITPSCTTVTMGQRGMMDTKLCVLNCGMAMDGCPTDMTCVMIPNAPMGSATQRCEFK